MLDMKTCTMYDTNQSKEDPGVEGKMELCLDGCHLTQRREERHIRNDEWIMSETMYQTDRVQGMHIRSTAT